MHLDKYPLSEYHSPQLDANLAKHFKLSDFSLRQKVKREKPDPETKPNPKAT